ncbi:MAG: sulfatase-like hydrolase/transferase [Gammaproteobacteria bacterium]|nr:sulfatase-like hydrolase/transferase [Gammaproteobacteria bacterium]
MNPALKMFLATTGLRMLRHLLLAAACALIVLTPDHIFQIYQSGYQARFSGSSFIVLMTVFSLGLSGSMLLFFILSLVLALLQLAELMHFSYFGSLISPQAVTLLFSESDEIMETLGKLLGHLALPISLIVAELILLTLLFRSTQRWRLRLPLVWLPLVVLFSILPVRAHSPGAIAQTFYPNPREYAVTNSLYAVSYFLGRDLPHRLSGETTGNSCQAYQSNRITEPQADNIVIIMGESLSASHMSLFGYSRDTTPNLQRLATSSEIFATVAYSAGVTTKVSLPMFYNIQREPGNFEHLIRMDSNLFKLAKQQGFTTHYISAQTANLATYVGERFIDNFKTRDDLEDDFAIHKDRALLDQLQQIDLSKRNFIILHQRNSHSPYDSQYPPAFARYPTANLDFANYMTNSYDNSILFTDSLVNEIIQHLKAHSTGRTLLLFTADHAELLGETGKFGHIHLQVETTRVPLVIYGQHLQAETLRRITDLSQPTHYEIGKKIALLLGYSITNPNELPGRYYVTGQDIGGNSGYMTLDKRPLSPRISTSTAAYNAEAICPRSVTRVDIHPASRAAGS